MMSPLKGTIWSDCMLSIDDAKRSVALKTCVKLKELGELNDHLLPIDRKEIHEDINHLFPNWIDEEKDAKCSPGTYSKKRKHDLNVSIFVYNKVIFILNKIYLSNFTFVNAHKANIAYYPQIFHLQVV